MQTETSETMNETTETPPMPKPSPKRAPAKKAPAKKAKKAEKKPAPKAKKAKRARTVTDEVLESARERSMEQLKEKVADTKVSAKGVTERLMQATSLFLVKFRKQNNLSCTDLAKKLDVDATVISHLESGKRSLIRLDKIVEYAKKLSIKPDVMAASIFSLSGV